ncbi:MAG: glucose-6-phosphate isomerase, partial [Hyphomicrobiales bacterium]
MFSSQDISGCLSDGGTGAQVSREKFEAALAATAPALDRITAAHQDGSLPLLRLPEKRDDLEACRQAADALMRGARDIVIFGTGGSSLGAQSLAQLAGWRIGGPYRDEGAPRFHFFDNLDPRTMERLLRDLDLKTARFFVVSKSGNTPETVIQMICVLEALKAAGLDWNAEHHFLALSEPGDPAKNAVRRLSELHGIPVMEHDPDVGGRFAVLSNVGLVPAIMFGLDPLAIRAGAGEQLAPILSGAAPDQCAAAIGAAVQYALHEHAGVSACVLMPYSDRLGLFTKWFVQLWAESLGKNGRGFTAVAANGPVDQHSQLQLYLDGAPQHLITVVRENCVGRGPRVAPDLAKLAGADYLA